MLLRWQPAVKDLREARDPVESAFFDEQPGGDAKAQDLLKKGAPAARTYRTDLTVSRMEKVVKLFRDLRRKLLTKYSGDMV